MKNLTDAGFMLRMAYQAMKDAGIDADAVLQKIGMEQSALLDKDLRTPHDAQEWFWQAVEDVSGDPHIGLHLGAHLPTLKGQVLEYLFLSSPNFGDGLLRALNYQRLVSDALQFAIDIREDQVWLEQSYWSKRLPHLNECLAMGAIKFFRYVTDGAFQPSEIWFGHAQHAPEEEYQRVFGCTVKFEMPKVGMMFPRQFMDHPSPHHEPELLHLHEQLAHQQVARLEKQDLVDRVSRVIGELLESGHANLEDVAERIEIKPRQLRTRLAEAGTNFNQLVADYRCRLAKRLLAGTEEPIDEIVYLTGFSEPSTFYRAFKRWVGMTPIEYRRMKAEEEAAG